MKILEIKKLVFKDKYPSIEEISVRLDEQKPVNDIDQINWKDHSYKPEVTFSCGYTDNEILLKYYVKEDFFKAEMTVSNQEVYEDSCVEFFVSPEPYGIYYNFEFNGIGTCLMGSGTCREDRKRVSTEIISKIRRITSAGNKPVKERKGNFFWHITIAFPADIFFCHKIEELKGKTFRGNFYKCGDKLAVPHFVTWNPIGTEKPDFHRPEYFGELKFI